MNDLRVGSQIELQIERMGYGPEGLGRFQGLVIFVPFVLPGETVQVEIRELKKHFARARLVSVLKASPQRRHAPCPYYQSCGGCDWQHADYASQLSLKQSVFEDILRRQKILLPRPFKIIGAPQEWHYRNRIQIFVKGGRPHFRERSSRKEILIDQCLIAEESINAQLKADSFNSEGRLELTSSGHRKGFGQVHSAMNAILQKWVVENSENLASGLVWDLFSGSGNLSFPLVEGNSQIKILGIESHPESCTLGNEEAEKLGLAARVRYQQTSVDSFLKDPTHSKPSLVILDPPREGLGTSSMKDLCAHQPQRILYVSCDPMTWARDVSALLEEKKYELQEVVLLDMFPQTHHMEIASRFDLTTRSI